jgi:hypothetical protein
MRTGRVTGTSLLSLMLVACEGSGVPPSGCPDGGTCGQPETTVTFTANTLFKLDLLLVVDQAALSMGNRTRLQLDLQKLGESIHYRFDTHAAIVAARPDATGGLPTLTSLWPPPSARCGLRSGERFLHDARICGSQTNYEGTLDEQLSCAFASDVITPVAATPGHPIEALVGFLAAARTPALADFVRSDAHLAVGILTAGDDADAAGPMADVVRAGLLRLKDGKSQRLSVQAFVALLEGQTCLDSRDAAGRAPNMHAFVQPLSGAGLATGCDADWSDRFRRVVPDWAPGSFVHCLPDALVDADPIMTGVQPRCALVEIFPESTAGPARSQAVPTCTGSPADPDCWLPLPHLGCTSGFHMDIRRRCAAPAGTVQRLSCATTR